MEHITSGAETPADLFFESKSVQKSLQGFSILCHKIADKLWQGFYRRPSTTVYNFIRTVLEQAKAQREYTYSEYSLIRCNLFSENMVDASLVD